MNQTIKQQLEDARQYVENFQEQALLALNELEATYKYFENQYNDLSLDVTADSECLRLRKMMRNLTDIMETLHWPEEDADNVDHSFEELLS